MSKTAMDLLNFDNEVFQSYIFWSAILALKMMEMSMLTGLQRFRTGTFISPEDCILSKNHKVAYDNANVERVRRAHLNDMENILPFFIIGLLYVLTDPSPLLAINLFRIIAAARIIHTIVYAVVVVPQPTRVIAFAAAFLATVYMGVAVVIFAW